MKLAKSGLTVQSDALSVLALAWKVQSSWRMNQFPMACCNHSSGGFSPSNHVPCRWLLTSCETVHRKITQEVDRLSLGEGYFRFNVIADRSWIGLAEWNRICEIASLTHEYVISQRSRIARTARFLLDTRMINEFDWTRGSDYSIVHKKRIDLGAFSEVHEVCTLLSSLESVLR